MVISKINIKPLIEYKAKNVVLVVIFTTSNAKRRNNIQYWLASSIRALLRMKQF